jgi:hypothetical protein
MRPERIVLLRSGRHLQVALSALQARWPGCRVAVVGTAGTERAIAQAGVAAADIFIYTLRQRFSSKAFFFSPTAVALRIWGFDRVAVLWNDPGGAGQANVDRTALWMAPRGFLAITPDGQVIDRPAGRELRRAVRRAATSLLVAPILAALYLPALILPARKPAR